MTVPTHRQQSRLDQRNQCAKPFYVLLENGLLYLGRSRGTGPSLFGDGLSGVRKIEKRITRYGFDGRPVEVHQ